MLARTQIPNGYARRHGCTAKDVDPVQLQIGTEVEMEHTRDRKIARQIALDHLCEGKGRPYYIRRAGVEHEQLLLKEKSTFGSATCTTSSRWVRGGVGFLIGSMLGAMIGGGLALAIAQSSEAPADAQKTKTMAMLAFSAAAVGGIGGLAAGAWKPQC